ncbi:MAG: hypothetical protein JO036_19195 [Candidatus Eremiobacteraeota bacterium]|nr:hypothetical protein [Candidatus Eremiobacteraeota bacterium]
MSVEMPKYRLDNGRTEAAQLQYLAEHPEVDKNLFTADLESEAAQIAQHTILSTLIDEKDLLPYFREHEQEEPLILTHAGYVLNGNRRLCVFRTLFSEDPKTFARFANVAVVILPLGDEKDLDRLESRLQRERALRADYPWYADAVKYRRRLEKFGEAEVQAMEDVTKEHIVKYIGMLESAERYLEYRGAPSQYGLLSESKAGGGDGYYAFEALYKGRAKFKDAAEREVFMYTCFAEMLDPKGRVYDTIPRIAEHFEHIRHEIPDGLSSNGGASAISEFFGRGESDELIPKLEYAKKLENAEKVRGIAEDVVGERELIKRDTKKQNFVYEQVRKATTFLKEAFNGIREGSVHAGITEQLTEAEEYIERLREWVQQKR